MGNLFTRVLFGARWIMAPVYLGLSASLIVLAYKFFVELYKIVLNVAHYNSEEIILSLLSLIDFVLIGGLLVMVIFFPVMKTLSRG